MILWSCFISKGPGNLLRIHGIMASNKCQENLDQTLAISARWLKLSFGQIFQQDNDPNAF